MRRGKIKSSNSGLETSYKNLENYDAIRKTLLIVLILNLGVSLVKIIYGVTSRTLSMQSDGFHSLFDGVSNIVGLLGIYIASQPPDKNHHYGHHKYETLAAVFIAVLLIFVAFGIILQSIERFRTAMEPQITPLSFIVMILTMGINIILSQYELRKGKQLKSEVLIADSMHTRSDIYVSLSVIAGLLTTRLGYPIVDPLVALLIAAIITRTAIIIIQNSSKILCDESSLDSEYISALAKAVPGVSGCHKVRSRGSTGNYHIDLHIWVSPEMPVEEAHQISHRVKDRLKQHIDHLQDVVIHIEPGK